MTLNADPTEFADKRVLISGGTKGLGRATVDRFLAGGAPGDHLCLRSPGAHRWR